ncbi:hypothetical protein [Rhodopirellula sp. MGV]|uniref:hypothetical protein n=1 Tax=Rhodopirellula sp. MGV TaxID=2023130 RepID=UPI000B971549|nr:hypothetical protein [Rhodopirellula sp. MGV]OYP33818.1 hypothetical protein CGZ80_17895 [Rhodopirellula sp. MGV]OYP38877.1 hypothetical protein CGZ80_01265 [Rhodopirellula sp. MGV]PNY37520.1 hypothetical protein C2E31_07250 [Rhodopirellula baltica]
MFSKLTLWFVIGCSAVSWCTTAKAEDQAILVLTVDPFESARAKPPDEIFGRWEKNVQSPDGLGSVKLLVTPGPDNLVSIRLESIAWSLDFWVSFYRLERTTIGVAQIASSTSDAFHLRYTHLPAVHVLKISAEGEELKIAASNKRAVDDLHGDNVMTVSLSAGRVLLAGENSDVEKALNRSLSANSFSEATFTFVREKSNRTAGVSEKGPGESE